MLGMPFRLRRLLPMAIPIAVEILAASGAPLSAVQHERPRCYAAYELTANPGMPLPNWQHTDQKRFSGPRPLISTTSLPVAIANTSYSAAITVTGGDAPLRWDVASGHLPVGLGLGSRTGVISGMPSIAGTSSFTVRVTDANSQTASQALLLTVDSPPLPATP